MERHSTKRTKTTSKLFNTTEKTCCSTNQHSQNVCHTEIEEDSTAVPSAVPQKILKQQNGSLAGWKILVGILAVLLVLTNGQKAYRFLLETFSKDSTTQSNLVEKQTNSNAAASTSNTTVDQNAVLPPNGVEIPVVWGDLGVQLVDAGVIDREEFEALYSQRGGLTDDQRKLVTEKDNGTLRIDAKNSGVLLNMLWALGLGQQNAILEEGPMKDPRYGDAGRFASTGGWTLANGDAMSHYSKHQFLTLTPEQQALVEQVSKNIFRPCCNNATHFPDCNHGMAMLGLLELLASQGATQEQMYKTALQVNVFWFPSQYLTIAKYFQTQGVAWKDVDPVVVLSAEYSSSAGYRSVATKVNPEQFRGGQGCGT